jgi:hypothetical protein
MASTIHAVEFPKAPPPRSVRYSVRLLAEFRIAAQKVAS